jgi:hypothetical protein
MSPSLSIQLYCYATHQEKQCVRHGSKDVSADHLAGMINITALLIDTLADQLTDRLIDNVGDMTFPR